MKIDFLKKIFGKKAKRESLSEEEKWKRKFLRKRERKKKMKEMRERERKYFNLLSPTFLFPSFSSNVSKA